MGALGIIEISILGFIGFNMLVASASVLQFGISKVRNPEAE